MQGAENYNASAVQKLTSTKIINVKVVFSSLLYFS